MSVAEVSPEKFVPDGKDKENQSEIPANNEEKDHPLVEEVDLKQSLVPDKDYVRESESNLIHVTNSSTNGAQEILTSLNNDSLKNIRVNNGDENQEKIDIEISTSSDFVKEKCKPTPTCSEGNENLDLDVLESCSVSKSEANQIISIKNKRENSDSQLSNENITDAVQIIPRVTDLKESPDLQSRKCDECISILEEPSKTHNMIISEDIEIHSTKENDAYLDEPLSKEEYEDVEFPSPLRPLSPQSQLRDLCKRGDADQLEIFLSEMCAPEQAPDDVNSSNGGIVKIHFTKKINKSKIDLDAATEDGWTALHDIITHECQFTDVARVLLSYGANVNTQDIHGDSPLHSSLLYHNTDNIELLLKYSANVEATNASGRKPIHIANDAESLELLLKYGASVSSQDRIGNTPLHYAVVAKDVDRVKLLLERGCDVDIPNKTGASPLHISSDLEIASRLLNAAANPNATDQNGNIALHVAVKGRHKEWAKLLISWKGDPNISNKNGKTAFNLAKDKEMKHILQGKLAETIGASNSADSLTTIKKVKSKVNTANTTGNLTDLHSPLPYPPTSVVSSPSILKRGIDNSCSALDTKRCRGPRLRFSDVNDYSGVEELLPPKRVKVRPIYSEPQFSSDED